MKISANPIQIPIRPRPSIKQANWDEYRNILTSNPAINIQQQINSAEIDNKIATWTNKIIQASSKTIPIVTHSTLPYARTTPETQLPQIQYEALRTDILQNGPCYERYHLLNCIQQQLQEAYRTLNNSIL